MSFCHKWGYKCRHTYMLFIKLMKFVTMYLNSHVYYCLNQNLDHPLTCLADGELVILVFLTVSDDL
jgi:hypothetical protein